MNSENLGWYEPRFESGLEIEAGGGVLDSDDGAASEGI